jgi:Dyp-type peroxidase family
MFANMGLPDLGEHIHLGEYSVAAFTTLQLRDIQGFGIAGFRKDHQEILFIKIADPAGGRRLIAWLQPRTASAWEVGTFNSVFSEVRARTGAETLSATWTGILISSAGYQALGVSTANLPSGEGTTAFTAGMATRSQQIGDTGPLDAPSSWLPPFRPGGGVHLCIVVGSDEPDDLADLVRNIGDQVSASGCEIVFQERGETLPPPLTGHEHFGFKDGISQPAIDGYDDPPQANEPPPVPAGEFVFGFPNAVGAVVQPAGALWTNGSFAVFRRLHQDVAAFRSQVAAGVTGSNPPRSPDQTAAAMMGRWPSGAPLELNPDADPGIANATNAFQYQAPPFTDDAGQKCPHFAHIRKANPRDETTPLPATDDPKTHRMIRRGIPFGPPLPADATADDGTDRGLHFMCLVSDLDRQFEFVQRQWLNDPNFPNGSPSATPGGYSPPPQAPPDGPDPVVGEHTAGESCVLNQASGQHPFAIPVQLTRVTAGEYFFVPSLSSLGLIGGGTAG